MKWLVLIYMFTLANIFASVEKDIEHIIVESRGCFAATVKGTSMFDYYKDGDTVIIRRIEFQKIKIGQIVAYLNSYGEKVLHRVEKKVDDGFLVKGSNNKGCDSTILNEDNLIGIVYGVIHERGDFQIKLLACAQK